MDVRSAFTVTYFTVVALRPRSSHVTPRALPVRERLRELELWAPCRLRGSPKTGLRLVRRRGMRAGRRSQQLRELGHKCFHYSYTPAPANVSTTRSIINHRALRCQFHTRTRPDPEGRYDSADLGRLRNAGHNVVDRPRPRCAGADELSVNHGGIVVDAAANISMPAKNRFNIIVCKL